MADVTTREKKSLGLQDMIGEGTIIILIDGTREFPAVIRPRQEQIKAILSKTDGVSLIEESEDTNTIKYQFEGEENHIYYIDAKAKEFPGKLPLLFGILSEETGKLVDATIDFIEIEITTPTEDQDLDPSDEDFKIEESAEKPKKQRGVRMAKRMTPRRSPRIITTHNQIVKKNKATRGGKARGGTKGAPRSNVGKSARRK